MPVAEVNKDNFQSEVLECDKPVLVNFWGDGCIPCDGIAPVLEELADKFQGKVKFVKLNVCENPKLAAQFGSMWLLPTLAIFKSGELVGVFDWQSDFTTWILTRSELSGIDQLLREKA
ncbi:thioredoxin domain-containing protein [Rhizobium leguminosarum bv. trifolii WSM2012]|nr:thioredoxin domain-containing protein [Rhizobium leguminosarum bv. trifolii WSM2012]